MITQKSLHSLTAGCALLAFAGAAQAETVLTFNWWIPPTHLQRTEVMNPWAEAVAEATNGEVRIEFTTTSLAPPPRQPELVADGVVDLVLGVHGYTPDRFVNAGVMELPFMATTGEHASIAYWRAYEEFFAETNEHGEGVRVLAHYVHSPGTVMARERTLDSIDDFNGLLVRAGGGTQDRVVDALGASVVSSPAPTTYELLANGVVDATLLAVAGLNRLGRRDLVRDILEPDVMLPAVAQGAVGIEIREDDREMRALLAPVHCAATALRVGAERAFLAAMDGSCKTPLAALMSLPDPEGRARFDALSANPDGTNLHKVSYLMQVRHEGDAERLGRQAAADIRARLPAL